MKFLCDEMLARLGRWLRAAGHDTAIAAAGMPDGKLQEQATAEDRLLLTCDGHLAAHAPDAVEVLELPGDGLESQVAALNDLLAIDWLAAPFSRCVVDNEPLRPASEAERRAAPGRTQDLPGPFMACPACGRLYWPGSHHRRMRARLETWNQNSQHDRAERGKPTDG